MRINFIVFVLSFIISINMCYAQTLENKHVHIFIIYPDL